MAQKYLHGQVGGMGRPTSCHIIGKAEPPEKAWNRPRRDEEAPLPPGQVA